MKSKIIKAIIIGIVVIGIGTGGYAGYNKFFNKSTVIAKSFTSATVETMSLSKTVQGTGAAYAGTTSEVVPNNEGTISALTVKAGDTVTKSQKLFVCTRSQLTNDVTTATRKLSAANSGLAGDKASLVSAKADLASDLSTLATANAQLATDRSATPVDSNKVSNDEKSVTEATMKITSDNKSINDCNTKITQDSYSVTDATAELTDAKSAVASMTVISPIAGLVTTVASANGATVKNGDTCVTISDMSTMKVKVAVDELDIVTVAAGQKATIKFDALADKTFTGTVESAAQTGNTNNNITTYDVIVSVDAPTGIRLGMNANVTIAIQSKENAIVIPAEALVESDSKKYVRVKDTTTSEGTTNTSTAESGELVEITTGIETEDYIEVTKGVTTGQELIIQLASSASSTSTNTKGDMGGGGQRPKGGQDSGGGGQSSGGTKQKPTK
jgi:HlyD family secretion protein